MDPRGSAGASAGAGDSDRAFKTSAGGGFSSFCSASARSRGAQARRRRGRGAAAAARRRGFARRVDRRRARLERLAELVDVAVGGRVVARLLRVIVRPRGALVDRIAASRCACARARVRPSVRGKNA